VLFGALKAGLIVVNVNPLYTSSEMKHQYTDAGVDAIVILANFSHNLEKIRKDLQVKHIIITQIGDLLGEIKGMVVNLAVKYVKKMVPAYALPGAIKFKETINGSGLRVSGVQLNHS